MDVPVQFQFWEILYEPITIAGIDVGKHFSEMAIFSSSNKVVFKLKILHLLFSFQRSSYCTWPDILYLLPPAGFIIMLLLLWYQVSSTHQCVTIVSDIGWNTGYADLRTPRARILIINAPSLSLFIISTCGTTFEFLYLL